VHRLRDDSVVDAGDLLPRSPLDRGPQQQNGSALTPDKVDTARKLLAGGDKPAKVAKVLKVGL